MIYKKHPEFNLLSQFIFDLLGALNTSHPKKLEAFKNNVLSKRNNSIEYYKSLIKFVY